MVEDSLVCYDIENEVAISQYWCVSYRPDDPICAAYLQPPTCSDQVEYQTIPCTEPYTTGLVNQSRYYTCASDSWTAWATTSSHCEPMPKTCFETTEQRTVPCLDGYTGSILEQKNTTCSDPYSTPMISDWITVSNSCTQNVTNPTSIESPLNPVSPLNQTLTTPLPEVPGSTSTTTQPMDNPMEMEAIKPEPIKEQPTEQKESTQESKQETSAPTEIVPGFGIAISFDILNIGTGYQQQQIEETLKLVQEQDYEREQNIILQLIIPDDIGLGLDYLAADRWDSLLRDNDLQRYGFSD